MMKHSLLILTLFIASQLGAQVPDGKLYFLHASISTVDTTKISSVEFPAINQIDLDSGIFNSMTGNKTNLFYGGNNLYSMDVQSQQISTLASEINNYRLATNDSFLVAAVQQHPLLYVYALGDSIELLQFLDSGKIVEPAQDLLVDDQILYVLQNQQIQLLDLELMDTIASISTPYPFSFGGYNTYLFDGDSVVYIQVSYATGAERFSIIYLDKTDWSVHTLFHQEFTGSYFRPVLTNQNIYMSQYPQYYSFQDDSFYTAPWTFNAPIPILFIEDENVLILSNYPNEGFQLIDQSSQQLIDSINTPYATIHTVFMPYESSAIEEPEFNRVDLFPNPADKMIFSNFEPGQEPDQVLIFDFNGRLHSQIKWPSAGSGIEISFLSPGVYLVQFNWSEGTSKTGKFIKH